MFVGRAAYRLLCLCFRVWPHLPLRHFRPLAKVAGWYLNAPGNESWTK